MSHTEFSITHNGSVVYLNQKLAEKQNISPERLEDIKESHKRRIEIFEAMSKTNDPSELLHFARLFDALEYHQQALWNFPLNADFHMWHSVPKCTCGRHHNIELYGTPYRSVDLDCPIHGHLILSAADQDQLHWPENAAWAAKQLRHARRFIIDTRHPKGAVLKSMTAFDVSHQH